jgi:hypothetical protein
MSYSAADLRCAAPDRTLPAWQMTCGFPAVFTTTADDGSTVGLCRTCGPAAVVSGYVITPLPEVA